MHSPPLVSIALNWVNHSGARERLGSTTSKNIAAQQAQGEPQFVGRKNCFGISRVLDSFLKC